MHMHGPATQLSHGVFLIRSTMLIARRTLTGPCRRLTCYYALVPIPLQSCNRREMRKSGTCRVEKGDGTRRWNEKPRMANAGKRVRAWRCFINVKPTFIITSIGKLTDKNRENLKISSANNMRDIGTVSGLQFCFLRFAVVILRYARIQLCFNLKIIQT